MKEIRITKTFDQRSYHDDVTMAEMKSRKLNRFQDWTCTTGMNGIHIDFDGTVWRGTCRVGGQLGNMLSDWQLPKDTIVCTKWTCD